MKTGYNTYDIVCVVTELQKLIGMRVNNVYDVDNKTYLIRLQRREDKQVLLFESGSRLHVTNFEWPKNIAPSGFSMKMRKHLKNKRIEALRQLGTDRIIDLQFGTGEAAYHVILELYDRGNVILTDYEFNILNILRPHTEGDKLKFAVRERYPQDRARESAVISRGTLIDILHKAKVGDQLKKVLVSNLEYGPGIIEHILLGQGFTNATRIGKSFNVEDDIDKVLTAIAEAEDIFQNSRKGHSKGYIIQKKEERPGITSESEKEFLSNKEFHPMLFLQHSSMPYKEFPTFNEAVDEFFSSLESQKLELRALQQEREAIKKLENVRKDHDLRLEALEKTQNLDKQKAELITRNQELVDRAILAIQTILANQVSWEDIKEMVDEAASKGDIVAQHIKQLKLDINHISLYLSDPYAEPHSNNSNDENEDSLPSMIVDIDLALSAFANARKYYDQKRFAAKKQQKTIESQTKALKSAERKTKQTLKNVQTITNINKARKTYWFEKFFWFISSENYLVIAGRDQAQNELIAKRYMNSTDLYVHADIHGASSVVIKNPSGQPVPPKTLNEAGTMAVCYSVAWDAKILTNAYWVWGDQVSKTAPTGEYLTTGSFMVRGKKNFLPPTLLVLGLGFLFRLEEGSVQRHSAERKILAADEEQQLSKIAEVAESDEVEVEILDESDEDEAKQEIEVKEMENLKELECDKTSDGQNTDEEEDSNFPDTHIKIQHFSGININILPLPATNPCNADTSEVNGDKHIILNKQSSRSRGNSETKNKELREVKKGDCKEAKQQQSKRGQKSKLKKIKEKYKDQDEEERKLRMEILQSSGTSKETKKIKKHKDNITNQNKKNEPKAPKVFTPKATTEEGEEDEPVVQADVDMLDALTGIPVVEDELLFAVPVVAPYNTLSNYKFKVKLTPGTGKRGKAARTAVAMFLKDRAISPRERDLLKAVKDEHLARNIPGQVKLSAPRLQNFKK